MGDTPKRVWVRLVGAVALLVIVAGSAAIIGRSAPASRRAAAPSNEGEEHPSEPPQTEAPIGLSPDDLAILQACVAVDSAPTNEKFGGRLRKLLLTSNKSGVQTAAYDDLIEVASEVERLRGFRFTEPVTTRFVADEKLPELVGRPISRKQAAFDDLALGALGVLRSGEHVGELYSDLVTDQVAGFYKPRADELVVPAPGKGQGLSPLDKSVLAHELEHALIDQRLGLGHLARPQPADKDGSLAALAVIEGSATLTGYRWTVSGLSLFDQLMLSGDPRAAGEDGGIPAGMPHYLIRQFTFPYIEGLKFACSLYEAGGWKLVNLAIRHPPATTLEILSPDLYVNGRYKPPRVAAPSSPGRGWTHVYQTTFGAANWAWLFEAPGDDRARRLENAEDRAAQWAGGELHVWTRGDDTAVGVAGGSTGGADFCTSLKLWIRRLFLPTQAFALACHGNNVKIGIAPHKAAARRIVR